MKKQIKSLLRGVGLFLVGFSIGYYFGWIGIVFIIGVYLIKLGGLK